MRAPATLVPGSSGGTSIVEIFGGASVSMSALTVRGPGSGTCEVGALNEGIYVQSEAHLNFSSGAVREIHDSPLASCFRSGNGITVGDLPDPPASITIRYCPGHRAAARCGSAYGRRVHAMTFSDHAQRQLARRRIAASEVTESLENQETSYPERPEGRIVALGRTAAGRRLKVVLAGELVVTVADRDDEA